MAFMTAFQVGTSWCWWELKFGICNGQNDVLPPIGFREAVIEGALQSIRYYRDVDPEPYRKFITERVDAMLAEQFYSLEEAIRQWPEEVLKWRENTLNTLAKLVEKHGN